MKYMIEATIEGELYLEAPESVVEIEREGVRFEFRSDKQSKLVVIAVTVQVPGAAAEISHARFGPKPTDPNHAPPLTFHVGGNTDEMARRHLLALESVLSYATRQTNPLVAVDSWEAPFSLIPETPEESGRVQVGPISVSTSRKRRQATVTKQFLLDVVQGTARYGDLVESMAFLRDGTNRQLDGEFIQAFYAFYFIIEGLYADGRSSEPEILRRFSASQRFSAACEAAVKSYFDPKTLRAREVEVLRPLMAGYKCLETIEGLQQFLIRMRQQLHHFSRRSTRLQPHPFSQQVFEPLADLTRFVATRCLELEMEALDRTVQRSSEGSRGGGQKP